MLKRCFDFFVALVALTLFSPLILLIAIAIRWRMGKPVLFIQERPGLRGKAFKMIKFRTMLNAYDSEGNPLPDLERVTKLGNFLRSTSLDELPELWNVLIGQMSLVGPRPLLMEYLPHYTERQAMRHQVRPGVTGWAQVNGRNAISWEDRFELDVWYLENQSFWLDMKILFLTVKTVLLRESINFKGEATLHKFSVESSSSEELKERETDL